MYCSNSKWGEVINGALYKLTPVLGQLVVFSIYNYLDNEISCDVKFVDDTKIN